MDKSNVQTTDTDDTAVISNCLPSTKKHKLFLLLHSHFVSTQYQQ